MRTLLLLLAPLILIAAAPKAKPKPGAVGRALYAGVLETGKLAPSKDEKFRGRQAGTVNVPVRLTPASRCRAWIYQAHPAFDALRHEQGVRVPAELEDRGCQGTVESVTIVRPEGVALSQGELDAVLLALARQLLD